MEEPKGPAGLDESGVSLFKTAEAVDEVWACQQRHLGCIQDPPDMKMEQEEEKWRMRPTTVTFSTPPLPTSATTPPAFEDVCSVNLLPDWHDREQAVPQHRAEVVEAWNAVEEHDKQPQKLHQLDRTVRTS
ncbi:uncharacterized protein LOC144995491 [Oryzias latipes]